MTTKVAFIIPIKNEESSIENTYFFKTMLNSIVKTVNFDKYTIFIYLGYNTGDILGRQKNQDALKENFKCFNFDFFQFDNFVEKGHLTLMWNMLFDKAYFDDCEYMYQCGDDLKFFSENWLDDSVKILKENNNIGISGPSNNNNTLLTQALVHKTHKKIFGHFLDSKNIKNYYLDDWLNLIYSPGYVYVLHDHYCSNDLKPPRYTIDFSMEKIKISVEEHKFILNDYIKVYFPKWKK